MKVNVCLFEEREFVWVELLEGFVDLVEMFLCVKKMEVSKNYLLWYMSKFINCIWMDENYVECI